MFKMITLTCLKILVKNQYKFKNVYHCDDKEIRYKACILLYKKKHEIKQ